MTVLILTIPDTYEGQRLDKALAALVAEHGLSRARLQALLEEGALQNQKGQRITSASRKAKAGEIFQLTVPKATEATPKAQKISLDILYEDDDVIVLNKSAGLVVHPAAGNPDHTLVNALLAHCGETLSGIGGVKRPGIVHRLDKETSGLMVVAKNDAAHQLLSAQFSDRTLSRLYQAIVWNVPPLPRGHVDAPIGRDSKNRQRMAVTRKFGKEAVTRYSVLRKFGDIAALLECQLETGRTHQIRVHLTSIGFPLVGDPVYKGRRPALKSVPEALNRFPRQALHAAKLSFRHPRTGKQMRFESELPSDMAKLLKVLNSL